MSYTVADLKQELTGVLHGTTLNQVEGLDVLMNRAARKFINEVDAIETIRITQITPAIYDQVYDYQCPSDLKGDRIIDIRPQVNRQLWDKYSQTYNQDFDRTKAFINVYDSQVTTQYNTGVKSLRIAQVLTTGILVNGANSLTANGTWATGASASNLSLDTLNWVYGGGSLMFDASAGGAGSTAYLEVTNQNAVDLSRDLDQGAEFWWVYLPDASVVTNVFYRWGSSSTAYWTKTVTETQAATTFQDGWNLLRFDWASATQVGSPDEENIDYLRIGITYDGTAVTNYRVNQAVSQLGTIYELEYYSKFLFSTAAGVWQETITADTNIINLDTDSYNMYFNLVAYYCAQQVQSTDGPFDAKYFLDEYMAEKTRYVAKIKSQVIKPTTQYYTMGVNRLWRTRPY